MKHTSVFLFCILLMVNYASSKKSVKSPRGIKIPLSFVKRRVPFFLRNNPELYELVKGLRGEIILGPANFYFELRYLTETSSISGDPDTEMKKNGKLIDSIGSQKPIFRKSGKGYIGTFFNNVLIQLEGPGMILQPIAQSDYPTLFINTFPKDVQLGEAKYIEGDSVSRFLSMNGDKNISMTRTGTRTINAENSTLTEISERQTCGSGTKHWIELAIAFDNSLCEIYGNNYDQTVAALRTMVTDSNVVYVRDTCVEIYISSFDGYCQSPLDPYGFRRSEAGQTLEDFVAYFRANRQLVRRDTAHLFTGYTDSTSTLGVAFVRAMCGNAAYGYNEGANKYVFTHELGHNLGCDHSTTGLMKPALDVNSYFFSEFSVNQISSYLDSNSASDCVATSDAECDGTCPGECQGSTCIRPAAPGPGLVGCSLVATDNYCGTPLPALTSSKYYINAPCNTVYPYILREYDPNDASITCCRDFGTDYVQDYVGPKSTTRLVTLTVGSTGFSNTIYPAGNMIYATRFNSEEVPSCTLEDPSPTPSSTSSPSSSTSTTPSQSSSVAPSTTSSESSTVSPSVSSSPSSVAASVTPSQSVSPSTSITPSTSVTGSHSASVTSAATLSTSPSTSASASSSSAESPTPSSSTSPTTSVSGSQSASAAATATSSISPSSSASASSSSSLSPLPSSSVSSRASVNPTTTPSVSTELSPSTSSSSTANPTETVSPSSSETSAASISPSSSVSTSVEAGTKETCGDFETPTEGLKCSRTRFDVADNGRILARVFVWIRYNEFSISLRSRGRRTIASYSADITTDSEFSNPPARTDVSPRNRIVNFKFATKVYDVKSTASCCGSGAVNGHFEIDICERSGTCQVQQFSVPLNMVCGEYCKRNPNRFQGIPMSDSRKCSGCQRK